MPTTKIPQNSQIFSLLIVLICTADGLKRQINLRSADGDEIVCKVYDEAIVGRPLTSDHSGLPCVVLPESFSGSYETTGSYRVSLITTGNRVAHFFRVRPDNFTLIVQRHLDREEICAKFAECCENDLNCYLTLSLAVTRLLPGEERSNTVFMRVKVRLVDINDNPPKFSAPVKVVEIAESARIGQKYSLPVAKDPDSNSYNIKRYKLLPEKQTTFQLITGRDVDGEGSGKQRLYLKLAEIIDREKQSSYKLRLIAEDGGNPPKTAEQILSISILDENDNSPIFKNISYTVTTKENIPEGTPLIQVYASDPDQGQNGRVVYSINSAASQTIFHSFNLNPDTGWLTTIGPINFEKNKFFHIPVEAKDRGGNPNKGEAFVTVRVLDKNDNAPQIDVQYMPQKVDSRKVSEGDWSRLIVAFVTVKDEDSGAGGQVNCDIKGNTKFMLQKVFFKENNNFQVILTGRLDFEDRAVESFDVCCADNGRPSLSTCNKVDIYVDDVNDNTPMFEKAFFSFGLQENNVVGMSVARIQATDDDSGVNAKLEYSLDLQGSKDFSIGTEDGLLTARHSFDREKKLQYTLHVYAKDQGNPSLTGSTMVQVTINDVNDNTPKFIGLDETGSFTFKIDENQPPSLLVTRIVAIDNDHKDSSSIRYRFISPVSDFKIDRVTGEIRTLRALDREQRDHYTIIVTAQDSGLPVPLTATVTVTILVEDLNDFVPRIIFPSHRNNTIKVSFREHIGQIVARIEARDRDLGANALLHYSLVSGNRKALFRIDASTGELLVNRESTTHDLGMYPLRIHVEDQGIPKLTAEVDLIVQLDNAPPRFTEPDVSRKLGVVMETSTILILTVALVCLIILVLLSVTLFLCGRKGLLPALNFRRGNRSIKDRRDLRHRQHTGSILLDDDGSELVAAFLTHNSQQSGKGSKTRTGSIPIDLNSSEYATIKKSSLSNRRQERQFIRLNLDEKDDVEEKEIAEDRRRLFLYLRCHDSGNGGSKGSKTPPISASSLKAKTASLGRLDSRESDTSSRYYTIRYTSPGSDTPNRKHPTGGGATYSNVRPSPSIPNQLHAVNNDYGSYDALESSLREETSSDDRRLYSVAKGTFV